MINKRFQFIKPKPKKVDRDKLFDIDQKELIDYINRYDKVSLPQVAEFFFPAPLPYRNYFISSSRGSFGFTTEKFAKTAQIV